MKFRWIPRALAYGLTLSLAVYTAVQMILSSARPAQLPLRRAPVTPGLHQRFGWRSFLAERDRSGEQEWMDLPGQDPRLLRSMFADLERVNRWLGGTWLTGRALGAISRDVASSRPITILDVASGSGDIPRVMARWAQQHQRNVRIIATDINPDVLRLTRSGDDDGAIHLLTADARQLPFADDAVDVVACSFFLHHLDPSEVVIALREMRRVSRGTVLINDMVRGWPSFAGAWLFSRIFTRNPISRHDAPLSARRSYSRAELIEFAAQAGLEPSRAFGFAGYRVALVTKVPDATHQPSRHAAHSIAAPVSA